MAKAIIGKLTKTSVQLYANTLKRAKELYPDLSASEFIRAAVEYTLEKEPRFVPGRSVSFED